MFMKISKLFYHAVACGSDYFFFFFSPSHVSSFWQKSAELTAPLLTVPPAPAPLKKPLIRYIPLLIWYLSWFPYSYFYFRLILGKCSILFVYVDWLFSGWTSPPW